MPIRSFVADSENLKRLRLLANVRAWAHLKLTYENEHRANGLSMIVVDYNRSMV